MYTTCQDMASIPYVTIFKNFYEHIEPKQMAVILSTNFSMRFRKPELMYFDFNSSECILKGSVDRWALDQIKM